MATNMSTMVVKTSDTDPGTTFTIVDAGARADISTLKNTVQGLQNTQISKNDIKTEVTSQLDDSKDDIIQQVLIEIGGAGVIGTIDDDKIITITSSLSNGTYTLKYENEDGSTTNIGTFTVSGSGSSGGNSGGDSGGTTDDGNLVKTSVVLDSNSTAIYNASNTPGYKDGYRSNSSGTETAAEGCSITGLMRANAGDLIYAKGIGWTNDNSGSNYITFYDSTKTKIQAVKESDFRVTCNGNLNSAGDIVAFKIPTSSTGHWNTSLANTYYFRISGAAPGSNFIVKVNEEIV